MIAFDTLHAAETLTEAGIDATHAKAIVAAMSEAVGEPITKADLEPLATKAELALLATKAELEPLATKAELEPLATKADIALLATKAELALLATKVELEPLATKAELEAAIKPLATKADIANLRAEISELKATLTWRIVLALGAFAALVRLMP